jgi:hypothetical protein
MARLAFSTKILFFFHAISQCAVKKNAKKNKKMPNTKLFSAFESFCVKKNKKIVGWLATPNKNAFRK